MAKSGKVLIIGSRGQLGRDLMEILSGAYRVCGVDLEDVDIRIREDVLSTVKAVKPDVVIHAAAYTDVDGCESNEELAMAVNGEGTRNVALACRETGARMFYYSTDYVFDGTTESAYVEDDEPNPLNVYGKSKLAGEIAVREILAEAVILRVAWMYGRHGRNFVKTMLKLGQEQLRFPKGPNGVKPLRVVNDQTGNPTWTEDIVRQTAQVIDHQGHGVFHCTSEAETSWYDLAREIFEITHMPVVLEACSSREYSQPAARPRFSSLENRHLKTARLHVMRHYRKALAEFLELHGKELMA